MTCPGKIWELLVLKGQLYFIIIKGFFQALEALATKMTHCNLHTSHKAWQQLGRENNRKTKLQMKQQTYM